MGQEPVTPGLAAVPDPPKPGAEPVFGKFVDTGRHGLLRRLLTTGRHSLGLLFGSLAAYVRELPRERRRLPRNLLLRAVAAVACLPVNRQLRSRPFPVQLRKRLEMLGPTYIKFGQILATREDLLPRSVTLELSNLLDRLPAVPFERFIELVEKSLRRPVGEVFAHVQSTPLGSASIGQIHLATLLDGERVILKVVKPGIRETLRRDTLLLKGLGLLLQLILPQYQPRRVIREFAQYTLREADLISEADNAETFAANFEDRPDIVFPRIRRELSSRDLLVMEYLDGIKPTDPRVGEIRQVDREKLVDLGAESIIRMLYRDGFFHADLHPANLLILPGPKVGFVDLGMIGRFDTDLKRTLLYYFYCLITNEPDSAANYLAAIAEMGPSSDPVSFRKDVEEICRQWSSRPTFERFSLAKLVMLSIGRGARHRMYFPVELVLMVKAIVTFEAVGNSLMPGFDVAKISRRHVHRVILERFGPVRLAREGLTALPEMVDALAKTPRLLTEGLRLVEQATKRPSENPFAGIRATLFGGFCLVAGAIIAAAGGPWPLAVILMVIGLLLPLRRGK